MSQIANILDQLGKKRNVKIVKNLLDHAQCHICHELLTMPMMLTCGHNYCYLCLKNWFTVNESKKLGCPDCRMDVDSAPQWNLFVDQQIKFIIELIVADFKDNRDINTDELKDDKDDDQNKASKYWIKLNTDRTNDIRQYESDKKHDKLFDNVFKNSTLSVVDMDDDGIPRCGNCHWEIDPDDMIDDDDNVCPHCHYRIRNRVVTGNSNSTLDHNSVRDRNSNSENIRLIRGNRVNADEYSEGEYEEIVDEIEQYNDSDLDSDDSENENGNRRQNIMLDDEANEDSNEEYEYDEDKAYGLNTQKAKEKIEEFEIERELDAMENEHDSELDSFIENDDDDAGEDDIDEDMDEDILDNDEIMTKKRKYATIKDDENEDDDDDSTDSEFYENQSDSFVSGDSLAEDSDDVDGDDTVETINIRKYKSKKEKREIISIDDSDEDIINDVMGTNNEQEIDQTRRRRKNVMLSDDEDDD